MILSLDPGNTTGWAMIAMDEKIIKTGTFTYMEMVGKLVDLQRVSKSYVVIEEVVPTGINAHSQVLADISVSFHHAFPRSLWVRAGLWKPVMQRNRKELLEPLKKRVTTHEGDAALLGIYALRHRKRALEEIFG